MNIEFDWKKTVVFMAEIAMWVLIFQAVDDLIASTKRKKRNEDFEKFMERMLGMNNQQNHDEIKKLQAAYNRLANETEEQQKSRWAANAARVAKAKADVAAKLKAEEDAKIEASRLAEESKHDGMELPSADEVVQ